MTGQPTRYMAFLRALNVGRRTVTGAQLQAAGEAAGFWNVAAFLASGNLVFDADEGSPERLRGTLEAAFREQLQFESEVFLRTAARVAAIVESPPFSHEAPAGSKSSVQVVFLEREPTAASARDVLAMQTESEPLVIVGSELYWLARHGVSGTELPWPAIARRLGGPTTARTLNTLVRMLAKFGTAAEPPRSGPGRS